VFTKNRDRLLVDVVAEESFSLIVQQARAKKLLEHVTVNDTSIEARAGQKSFQRKKSNDDILNSPAPRDPGNNPTRNRRS
jgi:transposase